MKQHSQVASEEHGFAIGVIGLTSIVSTCIDTFKIVQSIRAYGHDAEITMLKLGIERDLFIQWAYNAGLLQKHYVKANLFNPSRDKLIHDVLVKIKQLLYEAETLARKYGMIPEDNYWKSGFDYGREHHSTEKREAEDWCYCDRHSRRHRHRHRHLHDSRLSASSQSPQTKVSLPRKFMWTIHAKAEFDTLIEQLHFFIERLDQMVKSVDQRRTLMKDLAGLGADFSKLDLMDMDTDSRRRRKRREYDDWSDVMSVFDEDDDNHRDCDGRRSDERRHAVRAWKDEGRGNGSTTSSSTTSRREASRDGDRGRRSHVDVPRRRDGGRSGSYERPPSYDSLYSDRSSGSSGSSRSALGEMVSDIAGSKARGRSELY